MKKHLITNWNIIFYLIIVIVILLSSIPIILGYNSSDIETSFSLVALLPFFAYVVMIILPIIYNYIEGKSFIWGKRFFKGAFLGYALISVIFIIELSSGLVHIRDISPQILEVIIAGIILQGIVVIGEELPFRGYILPDMAKKYGVWKAVFFSSLFFSVLHIPSILTIKDVSTINIIIMIITITLAEMLLAICYLYDGLLMSMGFHFAWNFFQYHIYSLRDGFGGMLSINSEYNIITGGSMGPEGGLLGTLVVILALGTVFLWMQLDDDNKNNL